MNHLRLGLLALLLVLVACEGGNSGVTAFETPPADDELQGLVYDGLRVAHPDGVCAGMFEMVMDDGQVLCSHGPDRAAPGVDVRLRPSLASLQTASASSVPCLGDGQSGNRVQAVYAVAEDKPNRYAEVAPLIRAWAADVDRVFADSAAQLGEERHVVFVTDADCELVVEEVVLPVIGDDAIIDTIRAMKDLGYSDPSRKYLIWMDTVYYCGIAQMYNDDSADESNLHNGRVPMYARVDSGCWGSSSSSAAHELVHVLGGVQSSAPNASVNHHCTDEHDLMCYKDSSETVLQYPCDTANEGFLDCNHDDYYHPHPAVGSYLSTHWNVATSSFLHAGAVTGPGEPGPEPVNRAPVVKAGADLSVTSSSGAQLSGAVTDDGLPTGSLSIVWRKLSGPGTVVFADPAAPSTEASFSAAGTYVLELSADDTELASADTVTVTVTPASRTQVYSSSLNKRNPVRSFSLQTGAGPVKTVLSFGAKGKKSSEPRLLLELYDDQGTRVASALGGSPVVLAQLLSAGTYEVRVSGDSVAFELELTYPLP